MGKGEQDVGVIQCESFVGGGGIVIMECILRDLALLVLKE